ncbi:exonuclease domain-containing protein [Rhizoctonia solani AG-1 IA]|uniref:Exonuclease domain-containing protein n=1 Tax=Thanatephorus cucumeris (strain AG1-IA) TaxID=983506 RepID=L8WD47_THACA|nr:exonuclease domain-containing protein [Rhizoctonia solani AG-1 IA]
MVCEPARKALTGQSGLTQEAIDSPHSPVEVAEHVLEYIKRWVPEPHTALLAGNTVHADAMFLRAKGPDSIGFPKGVWSGIIEHLHYRYEHYTGLTLRFLG